mgnify:CR=1 FL=1
MMALIDSTQLHDGIEVEWVLVVLVQVAHMTITLRKLRLTDA